MLRVFEPNSNCSYPSVRAVVLLINLLRHWRQGPDGLAVHPIRVSRLSNKLLFTRGILIFSDLKKFFDLCI